MTSRSKPWSRVAARTLAICAIVGIIASADGAEDVTVLVSGRTWLLQGRDTYTLDGKNAAPDAVYDTNGPFRATFLADHGLELDNRPFGIIPGTWKRDGGRNFELAVAGPFPFVYDSFLRSVMLEALRARTRLPLVLDQDLFIFPSIPSSPMDPPKLGLTARVSPEGLQLTLILRNKRTYRATVTDERTGRRRVIRGVFRQLGVFKGPLVQ